MARLQLAINVTDIERAVAFYSRMFDASPAKTRPGYANFEIANPPLKLVLFESAEGATINHLGVETPAAEEVHAAEQRLAGSGLETSGVDDTVCCYAEKTETWVTDPDGVRWEWYVKTADAEEAGNRILRRHSERAASATDDPLTDADQDLCGSQCAERTVSAGVADDISAEANAPCCAVEAKQTRAV